MVRPDLKATPLYCPHPSCGKRMVQDECGIFCQGCGYEAATWADPVDADVPMDVLLRREQKQRLARIALAAAAIFLLATAGFYFVSRPFVPSAAAAAKRDVATISMAEMRQCWSERRVPEGIALPAFYRDPELFLLKRERTSQTDLVNWWNLRTVEEKLELLDLAKDSEDPFFVLPMVFEVTYFTAAQERDLLVARSMLDALYLCSDSYLEVSRFVCDHLASTTPVPEVQVDATRYVADLDERRRRRGH
jgi:hypothetical protein